jgi:hypothetical protein
MEPVDHSYRDVPEVREALIDDYPMRDEFEGDFDPNSTMNDESFKQALANSLKFK